LITINYLIIKSMKTKFYKLLFIFCLYAISYSQTGIGAYSAHDGGFENHTSTLAGATGGILVLNTSLWTASTTASIVRTSSATGGRTGPRFVSLGATNGTAKLFYSPQIAGAFAPNTTYQIQFWYKSASTTTLDASTVDLYVDNNAANPAGTKQSVPVTLSPSVSTWTKVAVAITTNATAASTNGVAGFTIDAPTAGYSADIDDFVIYQSNSPDTTAPSSPGAITATGASSGGANVSWGAASGGVDGGGYVVVRYATTAPSASDDVVQNGIYKFANTVGAGVVRYIGSGTSFTDSGLSPGVDYYYKVYTVDKAFNYSDESVTSTSVQSLATTYYYNGTGLLTDVASWGQNTNGTGTAPANFTDASQVFEIRNTTAVTLDGAWAVGTDPANGTKVRLGNTDQGAITLTINSGASIGPSGTGNFDVMPPSSGNQTIIYKGTIALSLGTILDTDLEVIYDAVTVSSSSTKSFGTISIINGANVTLSATPVIKNITVDATSTLVTPTSASSAFITIPSGGSVVINGTVRVPKLSGFVASNVVTANDSFGAIQFIGSENLTLGSNSTVEYVRTATGAQTVTARTDYKNLILTGTTPKTVNGPTTVSGTLTINQSTAITMAADVTVNGSLSFVSGKITTGNNILTIGTSGTISGADQATGWVVGNLKKQTASSASPTFVYALGDSNNYTPLALTFTGTTSAAGGLTAKINIGDHAQVATSGIDSTKSVNKTWTLTNDSLTGFGTYSAAFAYSSADIDGISTPANYVVAQYDGSTWSNRTVSGTPIDTTTTATSISGFGDFAIGECVPTTTGSETVSQCGGTYTWPLNNVTYSASETVVVTSGCNTATLNLTITTPTTTGSETVSQCGGTYTWPVNNVTYSASETVVVTSGCNTATLNLTITTHTTTGSETVSQCGGTYTWPVNSVTYSASETVVVTSGCNTATLNLTITTPTTTGSVTQVQAGGTYTWPVNNITYSASTTQVVTVGCNTATLNLTINPAGSQIPATFPAFCKGATIATATGTTSLKFYTAATGGVPITGTTALANGKTLFVTEVINNDESFPRVGKLITVNNLPATPSALTSLESKNICKYIGSPTPVTFNATVVNASSFIWTAPEGASIEPDGAQAFISFENASTTAGLIGSVTVKIVDANGCISLPKALALTTVLPKAPASITMTSADTALDFNVAGVPSSLSSFAKITKVGPYMGTETVFTLTAPEAPTAASYAWDLPDGVNPIGNVTGNIITVDFAGVEPGIGSLPVGVRSVAGCGNSAYKTLVLARALPAAPTKLVLTEGLSTTAITKVGAYTGKSTQLTLTATPILVQGATATSYAWVLPAGVVCESTHTTGVTLTGSTTIDGVPTPWTVNNAIATTTGTITINFSGVDAGVFSFPLSVYAVNGTGNSKAKTLTVTAAAPATPSITASPATTFTSCSTRTYTATSIPGVTYNWVVPAGATFTQTGNVIEVTYTATSVAIGASSAVTCSATNGTATSGIKSLTVKRVACPAKVSGTSSDDNFSVNAYPNPSSSEFTIEASGKGATAVEVYDMQGRLVENRRANANSVQVGARVSSGAYNVIVKQGANTKIVRVIKK
jgi:hypothetical protein